MSVRSFTQIMADHAERCHVADVLMSDPVVDIPAPVVPFSTARLFDTNVDSTVTALKSSDWDQLTGRA